MNKNKKVLLDLVQREKAHIRRFLKVHNVKLHTNRISMMFKEEEIVHRPCGDIPGLIFTNNYKHIEYLMKAPKRVKVELTFDLSKDEYFEKSLRCLEMLITKIVERAWPVDSNDSKHYLEPCQPTFQHIAEANYDIDLDAKKMKMVLVADIKFEKEGEYVSFEA